jgi:hypothetical protein
MVNLVFCAVLALWKFNYNLLRFGFHVSVVCMVL